MTLDAYDELKQRVLARGPALTAAMTEDDLVDDLGRLLREGLVAVEVDDADEDLVPRFRVTARGQDVSQGKSAPAEGAHDVAC